MNERAAIGRYISRICSTYTPVHGHGKYALIQIFKTTACSLRLIMKLYYSGKTGTTERKKRVQQQQQKKRRKIVNNFIFPSCTFYVFYRYAYENGKGLATDHHQNPARICVTNNCEFFQYVTLLLIPTQFNARHTILVGLKGKYELINNNENVISSMCPM